MCKPVEYQNGINDLLDINAELIFVHRWLIISIVMYLAKKNSLYYGVSRIIQRVIFMEGM